MKVLGNVLYIIALIVLFAPIIVPLALFAGIVIVILSGSAL